MLVRAHAMRLGDMLENCPGDSRRGEKRHFWTPYEVGKSDEKVFTLLRKVHWMFKDEVFLCMYQVI